MPTIHVDGLDFIFPNGWRASQYDQWSFYRNQFQNRFGRLQEGIKAVDLVVLSPDGWAWLIEVKDYRRPGTVAPSDLPAAVAGKVFDTLAALLPAACNANDCDEQALARALVNARCLRVVLHVEQPAKPSKLFPQPVRPADVQQKLRQLLKPVDAHPKVVDRNGTTSLGWQVS